MLPRSSCSPHVFVAHLGRISITNIEDTSGKISTETPQADEQHRDQNMFTIDETDELQFCFQKDNLNEAEFSPPLERQKNSNELDTYVIEVKNMNLYSLDTTKRKRFRL